MLKSPLFSGTYTAKFPPRYPVVASPKLDGIRCLIIDGQPWTRSLKHQIKNDFIRGMLTGTPPLDGEIIIGDPVGEQSCSRTTSGVNSKINPELEGDWKFYVFDYINPAHLSSFYTTRIEMAKFEIDHFVSAHPEYADRFVLLEQRLINNEEELWAYEDECVAAGYEGIMYRNPFGPYKQGRSTAKEGILVKVKRWEDAEGIVTAVHEEMENQNEAVINPLGKSERSSHKANKVGKNTLGSYTVRTYRDPECYFGLNADEGDSVLVEFELTASANVTEEQRKELWMIKESLIGRKVTFKYQYTTGQEKPRFPSFKMFRMEE